MAKRPTNKVENETIIRLGRRIKLLRNEKNMTQMDVAALVNIDPSAVRRYEKGRVEMGFTTLMKFAEALEVSVNDLIYSEE
ncbi:helix-turn-helix domain-containing protein [Sabulilitoribacter multivorans]|uniref:Helix-turn-helix domain-containing protein n=1 Tax=Flaviramulus multivorans TaxID=1304750 RepID=A0ABS9IF66_9FLAO|nr:helix-turn-helix transcriptional regulator [Flaviramulus multivorans]MCF7559423.1 helix-turn-helix domain-containing protein [Flaviramulus multivorans]